MKGVILAAGKGTRLYPITKQIPKPLLPIGNRPTIEYAFDKLKEIEVTEVCIIVGENEEEMRASLGTGGQFGISIQYARQPEPKGLAHAMSFARPIIGNDRFVMYLGDAIYSDSLASLARRFLESGCANLNMVKPVDDPRRFGVANVEGERIVKLVEKPPEPESNLAMAGVYFFTTRIWDTLETLQPSARGEYEITDAIQMLVDWGEPVLAGVYTGAWFDTGTLDSFLECSSYLLGGGTRFGASTNVLANVGTSVCLGDRVSLVCDSISDSVVLPGSKVQVSGSIRHCILSGTVQAEGDLVDSVIQGN